MEWITDRTELDVANATQIIADYRNNNKWGNLTASEKQKLERGTLTTATLNRLEQNMQEVASEANTAQSKIDGYLQELGLASDNFYKVNLSLTIPSIFVWTKYDIYTNIKDSNFFEKVTAVKALFGETTPTPNSVRGLTFNGANAVERVLKNTADRISGIVSEKLNNAEQSSKSQRLSQALGIAETNLYYSL